MNSSDFSSRKSKVIFFAVISAVFILLILFWIFMRPQYSQDVAKPVEEQFYASGELRSRTEVMNGVPDGLSQGWYTNGKLQVTEYFTNNISHGLRTKWYITGEKKSESEIVSGRIHGRFKRWYRNGELAEDAGFSNGVPHGISYSWYEDGSRKAEVSMHNGSVLVQQFWDDAGTARQ